MSRILMISLIIIFAIFGDLKARSLVHMLSLQPDDLELHWKTFKDNFSKTFQNKTHEVQR